MTCAWNSWTGTLAIVGIWRTEEGKLAEQWDVAQQILKASVWPKATSRPRTPAAPASPSPKPARARTDPAVMRTAPGALAWNLLHPRVCAWHAMAAEGSIDLDTGKYGNLDGEGLRCFCVITRAASSCARCATSSQPP